MNKHTQLAILVIFLSMVWCEDQMSLHVSVIDPYEDKKLNNPVETPSFLQENVIDQDEQVEDDLCAGIKCNAGERCVTTESESKCECIDACELPKDDRQKICTSSNQTFDSDCHFLRQKCWCSHNDYKCTDSSIANDKLDYYGECRHIEECNLEQKQVFPSRMRIWLDEVLHILNERKDLDAKYFNLVKLADEMKENHLEKYWTAGVAFEFCQLDKSHDHAIQKEELRVLISSIKSLENCIQPFLDECDSDNNDLITDKEWGKCLELSDDDLELLRKYC